MLSKMRSYHLGYLCIMCTLLFTALWGSWLSVVPFTVMGMALGELVERASLLNSRQEQDARRF